MEENVTPYIGCQQSHVGSVQGCHDSENSTLGADRFLDAANPADTGAPTFRRKLGEACSKPQRVFFRRDATADTGVILRKKQPVWPLERSSSLAKALLRQKARVVGLLYCRVDRDLLKERWVVRPGY